MTLYHSIDTRYIVEMTIDPVGVPMHSLRGFFFCRDVMIDTIGILVASLTVIQTDRDL